MRVEFQVAGVREECACCCEVQQDVVCPLARNGAVQNKRAARLTGRLHEFGSHRMNAI
jgi:hypothetical protein